MKNQRGYTLIELITVLWMLLVVTLAASLFGVLIWAIIKLVSHFT